MTHWPALFRPVSLLLACALLVACGSRINQDNFDQIQAGMTLEEVKSILGKPDESSSASFGTISGGTATWKHDDSVITVQFVNNKVQYKQFTNNKDD